MSGNMSKQARSSIGQPRNASKQSLIIKLNLPGRYTLVELYPESNNFSTLICITYEDFIIVE